MMWEDTANGRFYQCAGCTMWAKWSPGWTWLTDDSGKLRVMCSDACRTIIRRAYGWRAA
jgi:hypothetical protein